MRSLSHIGTYLFLISIFAIVLAGCAALGKRLEPPRIHISNIRGQEVKALESVFQIDLRVFNTNDVPITIKGIDCELLINGRRFASGITNKETQIPSYGTEIIPIVVYSSALDIFRGLVGLHKKEKLDYQIKGKVRLSTDDLVPSVLPFKSEGQLSFDRLSGST